MRACFAFLGQKTCGKWKGAGTGTVPRPLPMLRLCGLFRLLNRFLFCETKNEKNKTKTKQNNIAKVFSGSAYIFFI